LIALIGFTAKGENAYTGSAIGIWAALGLAYGLMRVGRAISEKTEPQLTKEGLLARDRYRAQREKEIQHGWNMAALWLKVGCVLAVVVLIGIWVLRPFTDAVSGKVTVYPVHCVNFQKDGKCAQGGWRPDAPTTYTVHTDQQFVVALTDEGPAPHKLFNCVIADNSHWTCTAESDKYSDTFTMNGGDFSASDGTRYVSRYEWLTDNMN
jgi:hypothetical protein